MSPAAAPRPDGRSPDERSPDERSPDRRFAIGLARAAGGALVFSLPLLMTQEMWSLGATVGRGRMLLLLVVMGPFLVALSHVAGFEDTFALVEDLVDALVAWAVAIVIAAILLLLFGAVPAEGSPGELAGMLALQAIPGSMGALLSKSQFGGDDREQRDRDGVPGGYWGELFLMAVGALFLTFNIAPTEEVVHIAYVMAPWQALVLAALSLLVMHAFVYAVEFRGQHAVGEDERLRTVFLRFTVVGYAIALATSAYVLWTLGRLDATGLDDIAASVVVLAFPGAIGAAAARLLL